MGKIILPRPENVRGRFGSYVTHDVYHIAERLQEVSPRLFVSTLDPPIEFHDEVYNFAVSEMCSDGVERLVCRVESLDGRLIEKVERMLRIPFAHRLRELEKLEAKWAEEEKQRQLDELYDRMGEPFLRKLEECNFIDPKWKHSYAKRNNTARRHRNFKGLGGSQPRRGIDEVILPAGVRA